MGVRPCGRKSIVSTHSLVLLLELMCVCGSGPIAPYQSTRISLGAKEWPYRSDPNTATEFVAKKLKEALGGRVAPVTSPPSINLVCNHISEVRV
jgi:hypothetical protein